MATSVTFDLFARDHASGAFTKVGQAAQSAGKHMDGLGRKADGLSGHFTAVSRVGPRSFGLLATGAKAAGLALGGAAVAGGIFGLKTAASMEQARISFTTMLGGAQQADVFLRQLQKFAASTPFEFPELQTAASSLISAGINANKVIPIMRTLGDVTSGMGTGSEGVQRATIALQQMSAAGKITGEDLNQLRDAGVPVFDLLAAATGKSKAQVVALAQAGKLGSKELGQLMSALESGKGLERFNGLMEKQSQSLSGLFSTLKDNVSMALSNLITPAIPAIKAGLNLINSLTAALAPKLQAGFSAAGRAVGLVVAAFKDPDVTSSGFNGFLERIGVTARKVADFFTGTLVPGVKALLGAFREGDVTSDGFAGVMEHVGVAARNVVIVFNRDWLPVIKTVAGWVSGTLLPALGRFAQAVGPVLGQAIAATARWVMSTAVPAVKTFAGWIGGTLFPAVVKVAGFFVRTFAPTVRALATTFTQSLLPPLQQLWAALQRNMPAFIATAKVIGTVVGVVVVLVSRIAGFLLPILIRLAGFFLGRLFGLLAQTVQYFGNVVRAVQAAWGAFQTFLRVVTGVFSTVTRAVSNWKARVVGLLSTAVTWLVGAGRQIVIGLWNGLKNAWSTAWGWISGLPGRIVGTYANAGRWLYQKGRDILAGLWGGLKAVWLSVAGWFAGMGTGIVSRYANAGRWLYQKGRDVLTGLWDGLKSVWTDITKWISGLTGWIKDHKGPPSLDRNLLVQAGRDIMGGFEKGLKHGGLKALGFVESVAGNVRSAIGGNITGPVVSGSNVAIGQMLAARYGWTGAQWDALRTLWQNESGWNNNAQNPTSTAYGIAQFLNSTWGAVGATKTSDPVGQISAGLRYIQGSYGTPINALSKWLSRSPHWYGSGMAPTVFSQPTLIGVGERGPETVSVIPHNRGGGAASGDVYNIYINGVVGNEQAVLGWLQQGLRELQRKSGRPVTI